MTHYSTSLVPASRRVAFWNDLACEALGPLVVDPDNRDCFDARMTRLNLGGSEITSAWSSAAVVRWTAPAARPDAVDAVHIEFQFSATSETRHCGRVAALTPGDFVLLDPSRPYVATFDHPIEAVIVRVPRATFLERVGDLEPFLGLRISGREGPGALLSSFVMGTWARVGRQFDENWAHTVNDVILSLIELVYPTTRTMTEPQVAANERRKQAMQLVDARLCDPEFTAREIAVTLGLTPRYIQMLFAPLGVTPSIYVLNRRLDLAAKRLSRTAGPNRVSKVALAVGFNDLSYFCRAFRRRFGVAPRDYVFAPKQIPFA